jgi:phage gpG-like protein
VAVYRSLDELHDKVQRWYRKMPDKARQALLQAGYLVRNRVVKDHLSGPKMPAGQGSATQGTLQPHTGTLRRSVRVRIEGGKYSIQCLIGTDLIYAATHEFGATIKPRQAPMLAWKEGDTWHFAHEVTIPARPFLGPSLEDSRKEIGDLLLEKMKESYDDA